jgi:outer membrane protein
MYKKTVAAVAASLLLSAVAVAVENTPLTLEECFARAKTYSDALRIEARRQLQAGERVKQADGAVLPDFRYLFTKVLRDTNGGSFVGDTTDGRFALTQPLYYGGRRRGAIELARSQGKRAALQYDAAALNLASEVAAAFYSLVSIEADGKNVADAIKVMRDRVRELNDRIRLGKSRNSEALVVESQIAALRAQEEQILGNRAKALDTLSFLTGIDPSQITVADTLPAVVQADPLDKAVSAALTARPDIRAAREDIRSQEYRVNIARGLLLPSADLGANVYTMRSGSLSGSYWDALLSLNVPLFQGGIALSRVREEQSRLKEAQDAADLLSLIVTDQVRRLYHDLASSINQAAALKDAYEKADKSYQLQMRDYRLGLVNNLDVLQAIGASLDAKRNLDRALLQTKLNKILLDIATGK